MSSALWRARRRGERPVIYGRDRERAQLSELLDDAISGQGSLVLISGEAGIGKTTLVDDLIYEAEQRSCLVLSGGCYDLTTTPPYGPWAELSAAYPENDELPPLPTPLRPGHGLGTIDSQPELFDLARRFFTSVAAQQSLVLVLEDLHWADQASLDLLRSIARSAAGHRILLLATYRDDEVSGDHLLDHLLPALVREGPTHRLPLQPLNDAAVLELVRERYRLTREDEQRLTIYLADRAEGHPFFTIELLQMLDEQHMLTPTAGGWQLANLAEAGVPDLVHQVIDARLRQLDPKTRSILDLAAVLGYELEVEMLREFSADTAGELDDALKRVLAAHLLVMTPDHQALTFRHALVRQTLYEDLPPLRRHDLHRQVGELLATRAQTNSEVIAEHFYQASDVRALGWLLQAAERAESVYASATAIIHCDRAIELASRLGLDAPVPGYRIRAHAREASGDLDGALKDHETVLQMARQGGDQRGAWQVELDFASYWASRDYDRMGEHCRRAIELARQLDDAVALAQSLNRLGNWYANIERPSEGVTYHEEALSIFDELEDRAGMAATLDLLGMTYLLAGDWARAIEYGERAILLLRQYGDRRTLVSALTAIVLGLNSHSMLTALRVHDLPESLGHDPDQLLDEAIQTAAEIDWRPGEAHVFSVASSCLADSGRYQDAIRAGRRALNVAEDIQHLQWLANACMNLGLTYLELFDVDQARRLLKRAHETAYRINSPFWIRYSARGLASVLMASEDLDTAREILEEFVEVDELPDTLAMCHCWFAYAELELASGKPEEALAIIDRLVEAMPDREGELAPYLIRTRADALLVLGDLDTAEDLLQQALAIVTRQGYPADHWQTFASLRRLYLEQRQLHEAEEARRAGLTIIDELAAGLNDDGLRANYLRHARAQFPAALRSTTSPAPGGLTKREREVAVLLARGMTNQAIADQLFVSLPTIATHVSHILAKLDFSSRTQVATWAIEADLLREQ